MTRDEIGQDLNILVSKCFHKRPQYVDTCRQYQKTMLLCVLVCAIACTNISRSCAQAALRRIKLICHQFPKATLCNVIRCVQGNVVYVYLCIYSIYVCFTRVYRFKDIYIFYMFMFLCQCIRLYVCIYIVRILHMQHIYL